MSGNFTLFTTESGGGASSSDYLKDTLSDVSLSPTNNTGFSSTISNNPISQFFGNDDAPKYGAKMLWIKDLVLLEDRSKWVNNLPTYQIIFFQDAPGVYAYVYGNVRLRNSGNGISVDLRNVGDGIGVTGVIRRLGWMVNTVTGTGTGTLYTDNSATGGTIDFSNSATDAVSTSINKFNLYVHQSSNETKNIHDFRLTANQGQTLNVSGVMVYFENASQNIDCFPGTTYVNKDKKNTSVGATLSLPSLSGLNGARTLIYKTSSNSYATSTIESPYLATGAVGTSGANTITVTTGTGASYGSGQGIIAGFGSTFYAGSILSVSTDTLTVSPTLPFGISSILYRYWSAGATLPISGTGYSLAFSFDPGVANTQFYAGGFGDASSGDFFYSDPLKRYRVWGQNLRLQPIDGQLGVAFNGASGFLQVDGFFQAADLQLAGQTGSVFHATFLIDGRPGFGMNQGVTGMLRTTVVTDASTGWHLFKCSAGGSYLSTTISKINFYQHLADPGVTYGRLAYLDTLATNAPGGAVGASIIHPGTSQRHYADELFLSGNWSRGTTTGAAGGAYYLGASTNSQLSFQYYGKDFALIGIGGASVGVTLDGSGTGATFNLFNTVASEGWHKVVMSNLSGTTVIQAVDVKRSTGGVVGLQNYSAVPQVNNIPKIYEQSDTPRNPRSGDIWVQQKASFSFGQPAVWLYAFGVWNKLSAISATDDPNLTVLMKSHGSSAGSTAASIDGVTEVYNFISWRGADADSVALGYAHSGDAVYLGVVRQFDGRNTSGNNIAAHRIYNKTAWGSGTNRTSGTAYACSGVGVLNGILYTGAGTTGTGYASNDGKIDSFNGNAWATSIATLPAAFSNSGTFVQGGKIRFINGVNTSGTDNDNQLTYNGTSTASDASTIGTSSIGGGGSASGNAGVNGMAIAGVSGASQSQGREWSGSWSSGLAIGAAVHYKGSGAVGQGPASGYNSFSQTAYVTNGSSADTTSANATFRFISSSFSSDTASISARAGCVGGVF